MPTPPRYRHRFKKPADLPISPYDLGFCFYNRGFDMLGGRRHDAFRRRVIELAAPAGGERILDAGCGTGLTALRIADRFPGCRVCGIDLSPKMVGVARSEAAGRQLALDLAAGSVIALPYPDAAFDAVLTSMIFQHLDLDEKRLAVAEIARVLVPGGRYVSAEFGPRARSRVQRRMAKGEYRSILPTWRRPGWPSGARN